MATYTVSIPYRDGSVKVDCDGISLCDFHLITKQLEDYIATRVSQSSAPMRPLSEEERAPISLTSWHTPPIGELEAPFEEECVDLTKACHSDDTVYKPVITEMPKKPKTAWQFFLLHSKLGFKAAGEKWREIEPSLKEHYEQIAASDKLRYAEEMKSYNEYKSKTETTEAVSTPESADESAKAEKKKRAQIRKEYKKTRGIACPFACFGCKKEYMSKNKCYEKHIKACKFNPEPPCYDGSDGRKSYEKLYESEDEYEEEALDVKELNIDGITYYHCEDDNRLFDVNTQEQVGFYKDGMIV